MKSGKYHGVQVDPGEEGVVVEHRRGYYPLVRFDGLLWYPNPGDLRIVTG